MTDLLAKDRELLSDYDFSDICDWRGRMRAGGRTALWEERKETLLYYFDALLASYHAMRREMAHSGPLKRMHELERTCDAQARRIERLETLTTGEAMREEYERMKRENLTLQKYRRLYLQGETRIRRATEQS
jgi:hypothetical protein